VLNVSGKLIATNTDYVAARNVIKTYPLFTQMYVLGNGGYAAAVRYAAKELCIEIETITRENWDSINKIRNGLIFNCTPVENLEVHKSNKYIDCITSTETGKRLSVIQASWQFWLYTGKQFPFQIIL